MTNLPPPQHWISCGLTHEGKVRKLNEDAFLIRDDIGLWAVADGMGGHDAGDLASTSIVNALNSTLEPTSLSDFVSTVDDKLCVINNDLRTLSREQHDNRTIGSTVVILLAYENYCGLLWAGDSRVYRLRSGQLTQLTRDHSQVEEMVELGLLNREEAESHPEANIITRAVGATDQLFIEVDVDEVEPDDIYLLCSDGLYKHLSSRDIEIILQGSDINKNCQDLIDLTLERGAKDNVSVVLVKTT